MKSIVSKAILAGVVLAASGLPLTAMAQSSGSGKPVRIVVPFSAGGSQDAIARYLANKLAGKLDGASVIVENKGGAGGTIAANQVAKSTPDGTMVLMATGGPITIVPHLRSGLPYDSLKDLVPVALIADTPMTLAVRAESPYRTIHDLLNDARARPGQVSIASNGTGTISHLVSELFAQKAGVKILPVPYRGAGQVVTELLGGQIDSMVASSASVEGIVKEKRARVLGTFTSARIPSLKDVPTVVEATGVAGLEVPVWVGLLAPAGTPQARIDAMAKEVMEICQSKETQDMYYGLGGLPTCGGPADLAETIRVDYQRWADVIRTGNIKIE